MLVTVAIIHLRNAGYDVQAADGIPGLFNVAPFGRDLTCGQLISLAHKFGTPWVPAEQHLPRPGH